MFIENKNNNELKNAIIEVVAFFDLFDYPLTAFEVWKYCRRECGAEEVANVLSAPEFAGALGEKNGFYFLSGREDIAETRMKRYNYANRKIKIAARAAKIFRFVPWVKMIAVGNIIGARNLKDESDIDFFIITARGRIWLARFFTVLIAKILGARPERGNSRDKICLSFFVSENKLGLKNLMIENDIYFVYWLACLWPIYDPKNLYAKLVQNNNWIRNRLPNWRPASDAEEFSDEAPLKFYKKFFDFFCGYFEGAVKKIQFKKMPAEIKAMMNTDTRVVVGDDILKFHINDRREMYREKFFETRETLRP